MSVTLSMSVRLGGSPGHSKRTGLLLVAPGSAARRPAVPAVSAVPAVAARKAAEDPTHPHLPAKCARPLTPVTLHISGGKMSRGGCSSNFCEIPSTLSSAL